MIKDQNFCWSNGLSALSNCNNICSMGLYWRRSPISKGFLEWVGEDFWPLGDFIWDNRAANIFKFLWKVKFFIGQHRQQQGRTRKYQIPDKRKYKLQIHWLVIVNKNIFVWFLKVAILVSIFNNCLLYKIQKPTWFRPDTKYKVPTICLTTLRVQLVIGVECPCEHIAGTGYCYWSDILVYRDIWAYKYTGTYV